MSGFVKSSDGSQEIKVDGSVLSAKSYSTFDNTFTLESYGSNGAKLIVKSSIGTKELYIQNDSNGILITSSLGSNKGIRIGSASVDIL